MKLTARKTYSFIEIKTDQSEDTIFKSSQGEIEETIHNLISVAEDLASYTEKSLQDFIKERYE